MAANDKFIQLQITYPTQEEARDAAKYLVENKLAACAQLIPAIESRYVWQGATCVDEEALLLCKTREPLFDRLVDEIGARHSYECPQIVAVALGHVAPSYAKWLDEQIVRADDV